MMQPVAPRADPATIDASLSDPLHALVASPGFATDGLCFAARQSGLYRSDDGGTIWTPALTEATGAAPAVTCVAFAPDGDGDRSVFAGAFGGVVRSWDGGRTWRVAVLPTPPPFLSCLVV